MWAIYINQSSIANLWVTTNEILAFHTTLNHFKRTFVSKNKLKQSILSDLWGLNFQVGLGMVENRLIERPNTSLIDWVETGHISISIEHIFQWSKVTTAEA